MSTFDIPLWTESNRMFLLSEFARLRDTLGGSLPAELPASDSWEFEWPTALDALVQIFSLSEFERDLLLLCAGVEMESDMAELCGRLTGRPQRGCPTFGLALSALPNPDWNALSPWSPLRRYKLIDVEPGHGLASAPLRIDERILHYLAGINRIDPRLENLLELKPVSNLLSQEHEQLMEQIAAEQVPRGIVAMSVQLHGDDHSAQENIAAGIAQRFGRRLYILRPEDCPAAGAELDQFLALWSREALLLPAMLLLQWQSEMPSANARTLAERLPGPLLLACREPQKLHRLTWRYEVNKPEPLAQRKLWELALSRGDARSDSSDSFADAFADLQPDAVLVPALASENARRDELSATLDGIAEQFRLTAEAIETIAASALAADDAHCATSLARSLWNGCRAVARPQLDTLAERIDPRASWDDLVLPRAQLDMLHMLASQARNRMTVYERWGFARRGRRGLGLSALFSGPSGTGKTLAAEIIANELELDLYRVDLSAVVNKYIGETEKNLKRVFDAADQGGIVLLFDEAEALFGKRSEVRDSHDRYANIEIGYLLQRMESFQGVAILTTNTKTSLDKAFQRRLRFTVDFPFPGAQEREAIWRGAIPSEAPANALQPERLAQLNVAGGNIHNIALNAAFLAAGQGRPMEMAHVLEAAKLEAAKLERPIADVETRGWV